MNDGNLPEDRPAPSPIEVRLSPYEIDMAANVGLRRQLEALRSGLKDCHGFEGDGWGVHIEGAMGEMAFAKASGMFWDGSVNTFRIQGDVGRVEVRTRSQHQYELIVRDNDKDDSYYVLVTGKYGEYQIRGYIVGAKAKKPRWSRTHGNRPAAFFVPHGAMEPVARLFAVLSGELVDQHLKAVEASRRTPQGS